VKFKEKNYFSKFKKKHKHVRLWSCHV